MRGGSRLSRSLTVAVQGLRGTAMRKHAGRRDTLLWQNRPDSFAF